MLAVLEDAERAFALTGDAEEATASPMQSGEVYIAKKPVLTPNKQGFGPERARRADRAALRSDYTLRQKALGLR